MNKQGILWSLIFIFCIAQASAQNTRENSRDDARSRAEIRESSAEKRASKKKKLKRSIARQFDQKIDEYYQRMEDNAKRRERMAREMQKPQYSDPSYFGHKKKPKKRPPGKKKFCEECGIWH